MHESYLNSIKKIYQYYRNLGIKAIEQCDEEGLFRQPNDDSNSIAIIVNHLNGNMLSRWTDFLTTDGEKEWRNRDEEFEAKIKTKQNLIEKYNEGWDCLIGSIELLKTSDLQKTIYIRNQAHTVAEAINRQLAHVPYHIGQIVYLSRMYAKDEWKSLSIAKGESKKFNKKYFSGDKKTGHYTDGLLSEKDD